jgi:hypothetical protein
MKQVRTPRQYAMAVAYVASRLGDRYVNGGTAYLTSLPVEGGDADERHLYWVTAQHVINNAQAAGDDGRVYLRARDKDGATMLLRTGMNEWTLHDDISIDVAVHPHHAEAGVDAYAISITDYLEDARISEGLTIFFSALPPDGDDPGQVEPIVRAGTVASVCSEHATPMGTADYTVIDATSVGGHSGSPCSTQILNGVDLGFVGLVVGRPASDPHKALVVPAGRILEVLAKAHRLLGPGQAGQGLLPS